MRAHFTFRRLEYFVAVGETGSIASASRKLGVSPPSISAAVALLEDEFGAQLFVRHHAHGMSLTRGGRRLFEEAKRSLRHTNNMQNIANDLSGEVAGVLYLGCLQTVAPLILPELRKSFERAYPAARICQLEDHQAGLWARLQNADLDMCLTYDLDVPPDICFNPLVDLSPYAMLPPSHPLAMRESLALSELAKEPMVLLDLPLSAGYFLSLFKLAKTRPNIVERSRDMALVRSMVANGFGYSLGNIRPGSEFSPDGKPLKYVPLNGGLRPMRMGLASCQNDYETRITEAFIAHCREHITDKRMRVLAVCKEIN